MSLSSQRLQAHRIHRVRRVLGVRRMHRVHRMHNASVRACLHCVLRMHRTRRKTTMMHRMRRKTTMTPTGVGALVRVPCRI